MVAQIRVPLPKSATAIQVYPRVFVVCCNLIPHLGNRVFYLQTNLRKLDYRGVLDVPVKKKNLRQNSISAIFSGHLTTLCADGHTAS
jgi:hypothetical protein